MEERRLIWNGRANKHYIPNQFWELTFQKLVWQIKIEKKFGNLSSPTVKMESKLAIDNTYSFNNSSNKIMSIIRPSINDLGAGTGNTNRNLRPRHLSE